MARRTIVVTAIPLAILLLFGGIGFVASQAGGGDGPPQDTEAALAIAEPVQAKWNATAAADATFTGQIEGPHDARPRAITTTREKILLDNQSDVCIGRSRCNAPDFGLLVNNGATAKRVLIDGLTASECTEYGAYIDGASDWWIRNSILHLAKDATQHGLRIASATRFRMSDSMIDAHLADKTTLWVLYGDQIELRNVKLVGGRNWFSINPENPDLSDGRVTNVTIVDCWIDCDQDWANAMEFMPGVDNVVIRNLHVRGAKPPIGVWSSLGGVAAAKNVKWKDIWIPAAGQPPEKPFDELEWVKLRDDDWERIVTHGGQSREEVIANGVGPLP